MNTHETYASKEIEALLLRAGFDWKEYLVESNPNSDNDLEWKIPLHIAQKWLREVKFAEVDAKVIRWFNRNPSNEYSVVWKYSITTREDSFNKFCHIYDSTEFKEFDSYEEALEAGIKKYLELKIRYEINIIRSPRSRN